MEVWDKDSFINPDDLLGLVEVDIKPLLVAPGEFKINKNFKLLNTNPDFQKFKNFGEVYIQARFVPQGKTPDSNFPALSETLEEVILASTYEGEIRIRVVHVDNVPITDSGMEGSSSDPYVVVQFPDKKEKQSQVKKNSLKPIFDEIIVHPIKIIAFVSF